MSFGNFGSKPNFEQELMDLFRPSIPHDKEWKWKVFVELFFFSANNERYTKTK